MKAVMLLIKKTFRKKWKSLIWVILAMGLLLGCFIAVFVSVESMNSTMLEKQSSLYGTQNAVVLNVSPIPKEKIPEIEKIGSFQVYGLYMQDGSNFRSISLGTADEEAIALNRLQLFKGRWPQTEKEIVVEKWVLSDLQLPFETDVQLQIRYLSLGNDGSFSVEQQSYFTVVGILENYANIQVDLEEKQPGFQQLPNIISGNTTEKVISHITLSLSEKNDWQADAKMIQTWLQDNEIHYSKLVQNKNIYEEYYKHSVENVTNSSVVIAFSAILILCGLLLVGVFLYLWIVQHQKKQNLLQQLGIEKKDLFFYYFFQLCSLILLSIPIGVLFGYLCYALLLKIFFDIFAIEYKTQVSLFSVLAGIVFYFFLTIVASLGISFFSLKETKRNQKKSQQLKRRTKIKSPYFLLAYKEIRGNSKQYFSVVISICLCFFMLSAASLLAWQAEQTVPVLQNDYVLQMPSYAYATSLMIPLDMEKGFTEGDLNNIEAEEVIQEMLLFKRCDMNWISTKETASTDQFLPGVACTPLLPTDEGVLQFQNEKASYGYKEDEMIYRSELLGVTNAMLESLNEFNVIGTLDKERVIKGEGVILCVAEENYRDVYTKLIGTKILFTQIVEFDPKIALSGTRIDFPMEILAIVIIPKNNVYYTEAFGSGVHYVVCNETFNVIGLDIPYQKMYIRLYDATITGDLEEHMTTLSVNTGCNIQSRTQLNAELQKQKKMIGLGASAVVLILICVAFVILILQYFIKLYQRKSLYQRLHVIGMTENGISLLFFMDYVLCVFLATSIAIPVLVVFTVYTYRTTPYLLSVSSILLLNGVFLGFLLLVGGTIYGITRLVMNKYLSEVNGE